MKEKVLILTLALIIGCVAVGTVQADERGDAIMDAHFSLPEPDDMKSFGQMVLIDRNGNRRNREMQTYMMNTPDGYNSFVEVLTPADVSGIRFLTLAQKGDDVQRLYLPALGTARRIAGGAKKGRFLGSDLYYYDMEDHDFEDFAYTYQRSESFNGMDCDVVEMIPRDPKAPYSRIIVWVNKADHFIYKQEAYKKTDPTHHEKTWVVLETKTEGPYIYSVREVVEQHDDKHKTAVLYSDISLDIGLDDQIFTIQHLEE